MDKKLRAFEQKGQAGLADKLIEQAEENGNLRLIKSVVPNLNPNDLRSLAAQVNKRAAPSIVLLASESNGKCGMVCICSQEAVDAGHQAGQYLSELAGKLGGKGGGKPDFAMGGAPAGKDLNEALVAFPLLPKGENPYSSAPHHGGLRAKECHSGKNRN